MKHFLFIFFMIPALSHAQELFSYTEPASNMAAKSIGVRLNNSLMKDVGGKKEYQLNPEIMFGISRKVMLHTNVYFSNRNRNVTTTDRAFGYDGAGIYLKYRFYSQDEVHSHFRIAAFTRLSKSNAHIHEPAIDLHGHNSGYEGGLVATKLINKVAISATSSFLHVSDNGDKEFLYGNKNRNAVGYTLSVGKLMLPKEYTNYNQPNVNMMVEVLGQYNLGLQQSYLDVAPVIQLILLSKMRIDLGYRFAVTDYLYRTSKNSFQVRLEYNFFNVFR